MANNSDISQNISDLIQKYHIILHISLRHITEHFKHHFKSVHVVGKIVLTNLQCNYPIYLAFIEKLQFLFKGTLVSENIELRVFT